MEMTLFKTITGQQFAGIVRWFKNNTVKAAEHLQNASAFAVGRLYETGDVKWANKLATAIESFGFGPMFRRCVVPFVCFAYDIDSGFHGKIQKGKRSTLEQLDANGVPKWESGMREKFDSEGQPREKKAPDYIKRLSSALTAALSNNVEPSIVRQLTNAAIKAAIRPESEVLSGTAQELVATAKAKAA